MINPELKKWNTCTCTCAASAGVTRILPNGHDVVEKMNDLADCQGVWSVRGQGAIFAPLASLNFFLFPSKVRLFSQFCWRMEEGAGRITPLKKTDSPQKIKFAVSHVSL
jgi:hypothetical protein